MIILHYQVKQNLKFFVITPSDKESSYTLEDRSVLWKHTKTPNYSKEKKEKLKYSNSRGWQRFIWREFWWKDSKGSDVKGDEDAFEKND